MNKEQQLLNKIEELARIADTRKLTKKEDELLAYLCSKWERLYN